eukprot:GHUV01004371.1.p1 GENE.GHUV01004371.1~~GHUV01004371.1.p1  ORF type:complete len:298 (+),score=91.03 GHUV01004371.1:262-1155(+)
MFGRHLLRSFRQAWTSRGPLGDRRGTGFDSLRRPNFGQARTIAAAAGAGAAGSIVQLVARNPFTGRFAFGLVTGGTASAAWRWKNDDEAAGPFETAEVEWVQDLAAREGMKEMLVPGQMLRKHPIGQLIAGDDHLFETMRKSDQVREFRCFYNTKERKFYSVVMLGKDVCGYPSTVHGGLTAALVDESFGGLYTSLLTTGNLGATLPGLTARLEMDYKKKIPAGTVLLITTELDSVEPRKVWMKASVSDGTGTTFATGRALFVAPNIGKQFALLLRWKDGFGQRQRQEPTAAAAVTA